jgi:biotin-(acetyl-CoA carboxylase) ligase
LQRTGRDVISLHMAGAHVDRLRVLTHVLAALDIAERESDQSLLSEWRQRCAMLSQRVELRNNGRVIRGQVIDLDPHEGLIVRTDAGAITHLPAATTSRE